MKRPKYHSLLLVLALAVSACSDTTGMNGRGEARVFLASASASLALAAGGEGLVTADGPISLSAIDSLVINVTAVEANSGGEDSEGWERIELLDATEGHINLLALPSEGADSIRLALGELEVGIYDHVRLRFDDAAAMIYLNQNVTMGGGELLTAGAHPLRVPSGAQTGLKIKTASFTVTENASANVLLLFDSPSSLGNLHVTGNGTLMMSPVLRARE